MAISRPSPASMIDRLGRLPAVGDRIDIYGFALEVMDMDERRIDKVLVTLPPEQPGER